MNYIDIQMLMIIVCTIGLTIVGILLGKAFKRIDRLEKRSDGIVEVQAGHRKQLNDHTNRYWEFDRQIWLRNTEQKKTVDARTILDPESNTVEIEVATKSGPETIRVTNKSTSAINTDSFGKPLACLHCTHDFPDTGVLAALKR